MQPQNTQQLQSIFQGSGICFSQYECFARGQPAQAAKLPSNHLCYLSACERVLASRHLQPQPHHADVRHTADSRACCMTMLSHDFVVDGVWKAALLEVAIHCVYLNVDQLAKWLRILRTASLAVFIIACVSNQRLESHSAAVWQAGFQLNGLALVTRSPCGLTGEGAVKECSKVGASHSWLRAKYAVCKLACPFAAIEIGAFISIDRCGLAASWIRRIDCQRCARHACIHIGGCWRLIAQ
jgi:hypothetical protein